MHSPPSNPTRLHNIEVLRGLASLAVAWFHLTNTYEANWVQLSGSYGWLGVEVFFVLSGFVIPLSIHQRYGRFGRKDVAPYMIRRLLRLEPPYLLSIALAVGLWELSALAPGSAVRPPDWSFGQILAHLAYAVPLTSYNWLQVVYWTLAYEFVFYLAAGALFWILGHPGIGRWPAAVAVTIGLCLLGLLPPLALLFLFGIAVFRKVHLGDDWLSFGLVFLTVTLTMAYLDFGLQGIVGAASGAVILATLNSSCRGAIWKPFLFLGTISYSLYLVHVPIGGRVVNLFGRFIPDMPIWYFTLSLAALTVSLIAATVFWYLIERPAIRWARQVGSKLERQTGTNATK